MTARWVTVAILVAMFAIIGIFLWADRSVAVTVSARDLEGRPLGSRAAPRAVLRMLDMAMEDERVVLVQEGPGSWRGTGRVSMAGRWSLRVELDGESLSLAFRAISP